MKSYWFRIAPLPPALAFLAALSLSRGASAQTPTIDFGSGFTAGALALNGSAALNGTRLKLTNGNVVEAASAFYGTAVNVQTFTTDFTFQLTAASADGLAFVVQGNGPAAIGSAGGGLGYQGIARSVAVKLDLFNSSGEGSDSTGLYLNGASPTLPAVDMTGSGIDLHAGRVLKAHLAYSAGTLSMTLTDAATNASFSRSFPVDIPGAVGAATAFVGFTAGTGMQTATQEIVTWTLTSGAQQPPPPPPPPPPTGGGSWVNVTPAGMNMSPDFGGPSNNFGVDAVVDDPARPSDLYASADYQGVWKSTDYGQTWTKVSTGTNASFLDQGRPWFLGIDSNRSRSPSTPPTLWTASGYGPQFGLYKSTDGGVNWSHGGFPAFNDGISNGQDPGSIDVDPHDGQHLLVGFHGTSEVAESSDGGATWKIISMPAGIGTSLAVSFIDTGTPATTRTNWIAISQWGNNTQGSWHTADGGATWTRIGTFEHFHGS